MLKRAALYGPPLLYAALLFWLSAQETLPTVPTSDKVEHFVAYLGLAGLIYRALWFDTRWSPGLLFSASALLAVLYGISDEVHQAFVPGRTSAVDDVVADALGGVVGAVLAGLAYRLLSRLASTGSAGIRRFTSWALRGTRPA
jgi:VanZ family protein